MAATRVIADPAARALPPSVLAALRPNGAVDIAALIRSLLKRPRDLPPLVRLALDAHAARQTLLRARKLLESSFAADFIASVPEAGFQVVRHPAAARAELSFVCDPASTG
jgi:hypothetical protein